MESPPQFVAPSPAPKKSNTLLIVVLVILGLCAVCCVGGVFVMWSGFNKVKGFASCATHYIFVRQAMTEYANAHGGKLPGAATWQDDIAPYYLHEKNGKKVGSVPFFDFGDTSKNLGCPAEDGNPATGMAFNADLAGKTVDEVRKTPNEVLIFEVPETGRNISKPYAVPTGPTPRMMGTTRPWMMLPVSGQLNVGSDQSA